MAQPTERFVQIEKDELEGLHRTHKLDNVKFIAWVKKIIKNRKIRINSYIISNIKDGKMLKLEVESFTTANKAKNIRGGISMGTRTVKDYLSTEKCDDLVALLDKIERKTITDSRDQTTFERPRKIVLTGKRILKDQDLDNLWD